VSNRPKSALRKRRGILHNPLLKKLTRWGIRERKNKHEREKQQREEGLKDRSRRQDTKRIRVFRLQVGLFFVLLVGGYEKRPRENLGTGKKHRALRH